MITRRLTITPVSGLSKGTVAHIAERPLVSPASFDSAKVKGKRWLRGRKA